MYPTAVYCPACSFSVRVSAICSLLVSRHPSKRFLAFAEEAVKDPENMCLVDKVLWNHIICHLVSDVNYTMCLDHSWRKHEHQSIYLSKRCHFAPKPDHMSLILFLTRATCFIFLSFEIKPTIGASFYPGPTKDVQTSCICSGRKVLSRQPQTFHQRQ